MRTVAIGPVIILAILGVMAFGVLAMAIGSFILGFIH
jgi:hypothetical protein